MGNPDVFNVIGSWFRFNVGPFTDSDVLNQQISNRGVRSPVLRTGDTGIVDELFALDPWDADMTILVNVAVSKLGVITITG